MAEGKDGVGREDEPAGSLVMSTRPPKQLLRLPRTSDTSQKTPRCLSFYSMHIPHPLEEGMAAHSSILAWRSKSQGASACRQQHHCCTALVHSLSCVRLFVTPRTAARQASLSSTISQSLLKLTSIESVTPSNHLILCCPLLLLPSIFSSIRVFSNESALPITWPKD